MKRLRALPLPLMVTVLVAGCGAPLVRGDAEPGKVAAIAQSPSSNEGIGWFLAGKSSLLAPVSSAVISADPYAAIKHYEAVLNYAQAPSVRAEAMRRAAYLRVRLVDSGEASDPGLLDEALALYRRLFSEQPDAPGNDLARYQQARAFHLTGRTIDAAQTLRTLAAQYPDSTLYADAAFRAGELFYMERLHAEAALAYRDAAIALPVGAELKGIAQYRMGWAYLRDGQHDHAATAFVTLLAQSWPKGDAPSEHAVALDNLPAPKQALGKDALRGLSLAFMNRGGIPSPQEHWEGAGAVAAYAPVYYSALGELLRERERYTDAAETYAAFTQRYPRHAYAPDFQQRVIATYAAGGFGALEVAARETYVERFAPQSPYWSAAPPTDAFVADFRSQLLTLAQYRHALAQQADAGSPEQRGAFQAAARWYQEALAVVPDAADAMDVRMHLADALFDGGQVENAAAQYRSIAYDHERHPRSEEAALAAVQAYRRLADEQTQDTGKVVAQAQLIDVSQLLSSTFPDHPERARVMLGAAEIAFDMGRQSEALDMASAILDLPDAAPQIRQDATAVRADSQFALADYPAAEVTYTTLRESLSRSDARYGVVTEQLATAIYRQGESARDEERWADAANAFARILSVTPSSTLRASAAFDGAVMHIKSEAWSEAAAGFEAFRARYPDHARVPDADKWLTTAYMESGQKGRAAMAFDRVASHASETADIREEASWQAARLHHEAGNYRAAAPAYQRYLTRRDGSLDRDQEARLHLADIAREVEGTSTTVLHWMREILDADRAAGSSRTELSASLAARANLTLGRDSAARAKRITLRAPIKESLQQRTAAVTASIEHLSAAIAAGYSDIVTEATFELASVYLDLSAALLASEHPPELDGMALQEYVLYVEEQAYPMEERAIGMHERNLALLGNGLWDEWIQRSAQELTRVMPAQYGKREQRENHYANLQ
jgi:cellulose synthase operon protein C